jgi:hypothetical protein
VGSSIPAASRPATRVSLTVRSTVFSPSLTLSVTVFRCANDVENARGAWTAIGAATAVLGTVIARRRMADSVRNDIVIVKV